MRLERGFEVEIIEPLQCKALGSWDLRISRCVGLVQLTCSGQNNSVTRALMLSAGHIFGINGPTAGSGWRPLVLARPAYVLGIPRTCNLSPNTVLALWYSLVTFELLMLDYAACKSCRDCYPSSFALAAATPRFAPLLAGGFRWLCLR